jgi:polyisoprenoid-binding protein YceI
MINRAPPVTKFLHLSALPWGQPRVVSEEQQKVLRKGNSSNIIMRKPTIATSASLLVLFCMANVASLRAVGQNETWYLDPPHSAAQFSVRHMGISNVRGTFTKVNGSSVDSRVQRRDDDLRSDHFFDVAKYPTITFKSKKVEVAGPGKLKVTGDLTIHGVTKEAVLDVDGPTPAMKDPKGNSHRGASATTTISRADYGMNTMSGMIGDAITIQLDVELIDHAPGGPPPAK